MANLAPKMSPKWSPKWIQQLHKKGACSKTRKTNFLLLFTTLEPCQPPTKRLLFGAPFLEAPKKHRQIDINAPGWRLWRPNDPQSDPRGSPKGGQNPSKIIPKSSLSRPGLPPAVIGTPPSTKVPKTHPNAFKNN